MMPNALVSPEASGILLRSEHIPYVQKIDRAMSNDPEYLIHSMHPTLTELESIFGACMADAPTEASELLSLLIEALHKLPRCRNMLQS